MFIMLPLPLRLWTSTPLPDFIGSMLSLINSPALSPWCFLNWICKDPTFSPPTVTESGSSAADSGWRISAMGFCPELARPFGAPTLILQEPGRCGRGSEEAALRFTAARTVIRQKRDFPGTRISSDELVHPLVGHNCQLTHNAHLRKFITKTRM